MGEVVDVPGYWPEPFAEPTTPAKVPDSVPSWEITAQEFSTETPVIYWDMWWFKVPRRTISWDSDNGAQAENLGDHVDIYHEVTLNCVQDF